MGRQILKVVISLELSSSTAKSKVGQILSGEAIGPGSYVSLREREIHLYFDSKRLAEALTILQGETNLALYFVPDGKEPEREQGREGGICHRRFDYLTDASQ